VGAQGQAMPEQVVSADEIVRNAVTFDRLRTSTSEEMAHHSRKLSNAKYFVVVTQDGQRIFVPGNVCMYKDNGFDQGWRSVRSGGEPPRIIGKVLGDPLRPGDPDHDLIDESFLAACAEFAITPSIHSRERAYWVIPEVSMPGGDIEADNEEIRNDPNLTSTEKDQLIRARRGQGIFRSNLMGRWGLACAVTGCRQNEVLRASHIKDWRASDNQERLDHHNGLLLCANLDALFDRKLISFDDDGEMLVSGRISPDERERLGIPGRLREALSDEEKSFLRWHRDAAREAGIL
jgi:hypothetical protein